MSDGFVSASEYIGVFPSSIWYGVHFPAANSPMLVITDIYCLSSFPVRLISSFP